MSLEDQGFSPQPFDFLNAAALALALDESVSEMEAISRFLESAYLDENVMPKLSDGLYHLTVRNALSLVERAAHGVLAPREHPNLLKYVINANMILRAAGNSDDYYLVQLLFALERQLITKMACNFTRC
jgi:hypothetical protein